MLSEEINLCVCWSPSVHILKSKDEKMFLHELTYEMKNGLPGVSLMPIGICVEAQHVPLVEKYLTT